MKLTLKYSSFLFANSVSLVKNTPVEVNPEHITIKDKIILNSYIKSGAVVSDAGEFVIDMEEVVVNEVITKPVEEEVKTEEVKEDVQSIISILDEPEEAKVEAEVKKKPVVKKTATKK